MSLLREWFGPSREEIWRQLADETGASYVEGDFWKGDKVQASHAEWLVTLEFDLFAETLDELCRMGAAYKSAPGT